MALIFLCGMPGAGKSTVGKLLAEMRGSPFLDLDLEIERFAGKSIPAIFQSEGEAHFRRLESLCLQDALSLSEGVIALGGGALESERNLELLKENGALVYLQSGCRVTRATHCPRDSSPASRGCKVGAGRETQT
jgi:shikimate kinase